MERPSASFFHEWMTSGYLGSRFRERGARLWPAFLPAIATLAVFLYLGMMMMRTRIAPCVETPCLAVTSFWSARGFPCRVFSYLSQHHAAVRWICLGLHERGRAPLGFFSCQFAIFSQRLVWTEAPFWASDFIFDFLVFWTVWLVVSFWLWFIGGGHGEGVGRKLLG